MGRVIAVPPWLPVSLIKYKFQKQITFMTINGVSRAGLQPLRGGLPLYPYLRYSQQNVSLSGSIP